MTTVIEGLVAAEAQLGRKLAGDEIVVLARLLEEGRDLDDALAIVLEPVPMPSAEEELKTYRYEASGNGVIEIPAPGEDETVPATRVSGAGGDSGGEPEVSDAHSGGDGGEG